MSYTLNRAHNYILSPLSVARTWARLISNNLPVIIDPPVKLAQTDALTANVSIPSFPIAVIDRVRISANSINSRTFQLAQHEYKFEALRVERVNL